MSASTQPSVTVAICTWNRATLLDQTLTRLEALLVPEGTSWELIVVDNNSNDQTQKVLAHFQHRLPLRVFTESKQGHSHARNTALAHARGAWILWTDDDVLVPPHWLQAYAKAFEAYPEASFFGGPIRPWYEADPPAWLRENIHELGICWALLDHGPETKPIRPPLYVYGANMAFRTEVLRPLAFDPAFGRVGAQLSSGDDTRVQDAIIQAGGYGVWLGDAYVEHFLPARRMSVTYAREILFWMGHRGYEPFAEDRSPRLAGAPRWLWKQYLVSSIHRRLGSPGKSKRWVHSLQAEAKAAGLIRRFREECR